MIISPLSACHHHLGVGGQLADHAVVLTKDVGVRGDISHLPGGGRGLCRLAGRRGGDAAVVLLLLAAIRAGNMLSSCYGSLPDRAYGHKARHLRPSGGGSIGNKI